MSKALGIEIRDDASWAVARISKTPFGIKIGGYRSLIGPEEKIAGEIKGFIHESGLENVPLTIGLPRGMVISRVLKIPAHRVEDLRGIMAFEIERHLPFSIEDIHYDFQPLNKDGNLWNVIMVAAKKELIDRYAELIRELPVELTCIDARPFSIFNALSYWNRIPRDKKIAIISFGTDEIEIDTFHNDMLTGSKTIPMDEERWPQWIKIIEREMRVSIEDTETLPDQKELDRIMIIADRQIDEKERSILERDTGVPVTMESPEDHNLPAGISISTFGLALRGVGKGDLKLNLLPTASEKKATSPVPTLILTVLAILIGIAVGFSISAKDRLVLSKLNSAIEEIAPKTKEVKILKERLKNIEAELMILEKGEVRPTPLELLKELTEIIPEHTWLTDMNYSKGEISIIGLSDQASTLLPLLEDLSLLKNVEFTGSITTETGGKERFKIKAQVN
ncbi:MAG: PilN domain-containing protein [Thermodesulfobacteriota bacterium]